MTDRPDSFDTKAFLEFCRSKPADEEYCAASPRSCALAQFGYRDVGQCDHADFGIPTPVYQAIFRRPEEMNLPCTFGRLSDRLAKLVEAK